MKRLTLLLAIVSLAACTAVPTNYQTGELIASEGVRNFFEQSGVDAVEAGGQIRCERHRRVGTHLITRVCMTNEEWEEQEKRHRELAQDRLNQRCLPSQQGAPFEPGIVGGRTAPSSCGAGSVR